MASNSAQHSDDDDYMSSDILNLCGDTRPGLLSKDAARALKGQRRHEALNVKNKTKPMRQLEKEHRDSALQTAIKQDNKGFALMQKMGFKPGMSLGRTGQEGRKEPIPIELKVNRSGLGHEKEVRRKREIAGKERMVYIQKRQKVQQYEVHDYRSRKRNELLEKLTEKDLWNSQKVCHQLDEKLNLAEPLQAFFWPKIPKTKEAEDENEESNDEDDDETSEDAKEEEEEEISASEKLGILTEYLRNTHHYCLWCGTAYNDADDLNQNCPGNTRQDHDD